MSKARRASWWTEAGVEDDYIVPRGTPCRIESGNLAREWVAKDDMVVIADNDYSDGKRYFIDSRFKRLPKLGSIIEDRETLARLPNKSVVLDEDEDSWQKEGDVWWLSHSNPTVPDVFEYSPLKLIHLAESKDTTILDRPSWWLEIKDFDTGLPKGTLVRKEKLNRNNDAVEFYVSNDKPLEGSGDAKYFIDSRQLIGRRISKIKEKILEEGLGHE